MKDENDVSEGLAPAFPIRDLNDHPGPWGLTLRDYFAAKAMASGMLVFADEPAEIPPVDALAKKAYEMAAAMLKAREA